MTSNNRDYGKVAVLFGGHSAEREVSLRSGQAVFKALEAQGLDVVAFDPAEAELAELKRQHIDRALIMLHGRGGEDGRLQGALEYLGIPYTGSNVLGSALAMDKIRSKQIWQNLALPTANYTVIDKSHFDERSCADIIDLLGGSIMVKPSNEGSSIGMAKADNAQQLLAAVKQAFEYDRQVLLEQYIVGQEYTVTILNGEALPSIRMQTPHVFYDYSAKYQSDTTEYFCPSGLDQEIENYLGEIALQAFSAVSASGWGRVDFMCDQQGQFYLLEANTVPGMTEKSLVPMAAKVAGKSFKQLALAILDTSFKA